MNWIDYFDVETVNTEFDSIDYSLYLQEEMQDKTVEINSEEHIAVIQEGLLRIWELIKSALYRDQDVLDYVDVEHQYASSAWGSEDIEKRLLFQLKRLQSFLKWEQTYKKHSEFEQFVGKFLMRLVGFYSQEKASLKIKSILLETLNQATEKRRNLSRSHTTKTIGMSAFGRQVRRKAKPHIEETLPPLDLQELREKAGLPPKTYKQDSLFKEKQNFSLFGNLQAPKLPLEKESVLHSIYKDSPFYKKYTNEGPTVNVLDEPIKNSITDLERLDDLNLLVDEEKEDFSTRKVLRFRDKRLTIPPRLPRTFSKDTIYREDTENLDSIRSEIVDEDSCEESSEPSEVMENINEKLRQLTDFKELRPCEILPILTSYAPPPVRVLGRLQRRLK